MGDTTRRADGCVCDPTYEYSDYPLARCPVHGTAGPAGLMGGETATTCGNTAEGITTSPWVEVCELPAEHPGSHREGHVRWTRSPWEPSPEAIDRDGT